MSIDAIENFKLSVNDDKGGVTTGNSTNLDKFNCFEIKRGKKGVTQLKNTIIISGLVLIIILICLFHEDKTIINR